MVMVGFLLINLVSIPDLCHSVGNINSVIY